MFGVSTDSANWGVVGWSMGGTCAVDLTVMHPELFSTFVDIAGDIGPNAGTKDQTIARIYGGDAAAWAVYDPTTVINKHGPYHGVSGWFAISSDAPTAAARAGCGNPDADRARRAGRRGQPRRPDRGSATRCARWAAPTASAVRSSRTPGKHDWPLAADVFTSSLPWLAGQIGTPGVPKIPLPGASVPGGPCNARRCCLRRTETPACRVASG